MIFSVCGDIHGRIDYLYGSVSRWQQINKKFVDLIFQVGDFGFFKEIPNEDLTTLRKAEKDKGELIVSHLLQGKIEWETIKNSVATRNPFSKVDAPIIFIDGNHDDHKLINKYVQASNGAPLVQINEHLAYLRRGKYATIEFENEQLIVGGLGGIDKLNRLKKYNKNKDIAFSDDELFSLMDPPEEVDIFLTHMYPYEVRVNGSKDLTELVNLDIQPRYHFFGHDHKHYRFPTTSGYSIGLGLIEKSLNKNIEEGNLIFLEKKNSKLYEL